MSSFSTRLIPVAVLCLAVSGVAFGQVRTKAGKKKAAPPSTAAKPKFDPRDFSGYWEGPPPNERPAEDARPAFTPTGAEAMKKRMPIYISKTPRDANKENPGCRSSTCSNDPAHACNPMGFPRLVWEENEPIEFVYTPGRILQLFQWGRTLRELWTDGRKLPTGQALDNLGPSWFGISAAHWEGNTLVVDTVGFNDQTWLDYSGHPHSDALHVIEQYHRADRDHLEMTITIDDPKMYTKPWVAVKLRLRLQSPGFDIREMECAPIETEEYNKQFADPAAGIDAK